MLGRQTLTTRYWTETLKITDADIEDIFSIMLEDETPLESRAMVRMFIANRVRQEDEVWRNRLAEGELFQPGSSYEAGQKLLFPTLDFAVGEVVGSRAGSNPEYGDFTVIEVAFSDGIKREFASELQAPHALDLAAEDDGEIAVDALLEPVDIDQLAADYGAVVREKLEDRLLEEADVVYATGLWFLKSLLPAVDEGQVNLAEAILDMNNGGPMLASDILPILDLPAEVNSTLQMFALNNILYRDIRFDEVGPAGTVAWYLQRLEPAEVRQTPERLLYDPIPYDRDLLSESSLALEATIADEYSPLTAVERAADTVTLTLLYPHRRTGTLPLTAELEAMFPTAYEAERILVVLIDGQTGDEFQGWVVRKGRYVFGLERFYRKHKLPIGVYVSVSRTDDPGRFVVDFDAHRPRTEWVMLVEPHEDRIRFQNHRRSIGAAYDDLMVLGADDLDAVDALWQIPQNQRRSLLQTIRDLMPELARLNPQAAVHTKTLYSAVNVVRRCPPGPIMAALESQAEFETVGDQYWRFVKNA